MALQNGDMACDHTPHHYDGTTERGFHDGVSLRVSERVSVFLLRGEALSNPLANVDFDLFFASIQQHAGTVEHQRKWFELKA